MFSTVKKALNIQSKAEKKAKLFAEARTHSAYSALGWNSLTTFGLSTRLTCTVAYDELNGLVAVGSIEGLIKV